MFWCVINSVAQFLCILQFAIIGWFSSCLCSGGGLLIVGLLVGWGLVSSWLIAWFVHLIWCGNGALVV